MTQQAGFYLSIPNPANPLEPILTVLTAATTIEEAEEYAADAGMESFIAAEYDDDETVFGTLFQIGENGCLVTSDCFTVCGPEAR